MDKYELIQIINRDCYEVGETIQMIKELIDDVNNNPKKFIVELTREIEEFAEKLSRCPKCGDELIVIDKRDEPRGEMQGREVYETVYKYGCDCGYIKD